IAGLLFVYEFAADGNFGTGVDVFLQNLFVILAVEGIAAENEHVGRGLISDVGEAATDGIGGALEPGFGFGGLLGGQHLDAPAGEVVELISVCDVAVEGCAIELGQYEDAPDAGIDAVAYGDIDQS